jgi:DNA-binding transcriptional MerR regulator
MPTLQKYKKAYADRIPSVGEGRRQRYPRAAVAVLRQLKKENLARRGRPPKSGGRPRAAGSKRAPSAGATSKDLLTLTEISRRTKISYPTVSRYVKLFLDRIPHVGSGRQRRFPPQAVAAFLALRQESRPGRPARAVREQQQPRSTGEASLAARLRRLEQAQVELSRQVGALVKQLKKPLQLTIKGR